MCSKKRNEKFDPSEDVTKQEFNIIFAIDNSNGMQGEKIDAVNNAIRDVIGAIIEEQKCIDNVTIKFSAMTFGNDAKWLYTEPKTAENFKWKNIAVEGDANLSAAFDELARYLCKKKNGGQMPDFGNIASFIFLITDAMPTSPDWESHLISLWQNDRFHAAIKFAFTFNEKDDDMRDMLARFTGDSSWAESAFPTEAFCWKIKQLTIDAANVISAVASTATIKSPENRDCHCQGR